MMGTMPRAADPRVRSGGSGWAAQSAVAPSRSRPTAAGVAADLFEARDAEAADDARNAGENAMADLAEQAVRTALDFGSPQMRAVMVARLKRLLPELGEPRPAIDASLDEKIVVTSALRSLTDIARRQKTDVSRQSVEAARAVLLRWFRAATPPAVREG